MSPRRRHGVHLVLGIALALATAGCSGDDAGMEQGAPPDPIPGGSAAVGGGARDRDGGGIGIGRGDAGGTCTTTGEHEHEHTSDAAMHVAAALPAASYNSSPPSSGPHCPRWGRYGIYAEDSPLPACNFLHNLEHGAIVLLYHCPDGCPELVMELTQVLNDTPDDPDCGIQRLILTPYAEMDATIAAAAWGFTWTSSAACFDDAARASLLAFIEAHWGTHGDAPEAQLCADGG